MSREDTVPRTHSYHLTVTWTGAGATGTTGYRDFARDHDVTADGPAPIAGSSDPWYLLHEDAHDHRFIANSVNFPVRCEPVVTAG